MSGMFGDCSSLVSLDISSFKTDKVTNMMNMFCRCSSLTSLDVSSFNTKNVEDMDGLFYGLASLKTLDVSNLNTTKITDMSVMFQGCSSLKELDLSNFDTSNVKDMDWMFGSCYSLTTIYASERWNTSNVESSDNMFEGCSNLVGGAGTPYNANHTGADYARIDERPDNPGYFTYKASSTGIRNIYQDKQNVKWYTFDGKQTTNSRKGLNILRKNNGKIRKMVVK